MYKTIYKIFTYNVSLNIALRLHHEQSYACNGDVGVGDGDRDDVCTTKGERSWDCEPYVYPPQCLKLLAAVKLVLKVILTRKMT